MKTPTAATARFSRRTSLYIDKALDVSRAMVQARWTVVGVTPNGVELQKTMFGKVQRLHICTDRLGAT